MKHRRQTAHTEEKNLCMDEWGNTFGDVMSLSWLMIEGEGQEKTQKREPERRKEKTHTQARTNEKEKICGQAFLVPTFDISIFSE